MNTMTRGAGPASSLAAAPFWLEAAECHLPDLIELVAQRTALDDYPLAAALQSNALLYDGDALRARLAGADAAAADARALQAEWGAALLHGPGIVVLKRAVADMGIIDDVNAVFQAIIDEQRAGGGASGDHFARPGANDRIWNAQQKLCQRAPAAFARYYGNPLLALMCQAWLGPSYQVTAQVNVVNPGGAAQAPHRDYHLGFQSAQACAGYPAHVHQLSAGLTLQGAVAHCAMPLETGPTLYLPHSQKYLPGYLAYHQPAFRAYFDQHHVQLPLDKGDAVFFNPALFHAAGHNRSGDVRRIANLLQVSSPFGRAMESLDRRAMSEALYPALLTLRAQGRLTAAEAGYAVAACAEGYAFPGNLDRDPPLGGMTPQTQQQIVQQALAELWPVQRLSEALAQKQSRQQA